MAKDKEESENRTVEEMEEEKPSQGKFPLHIGFILGNEFCERYSYYGMRTILIFFLTSYLGWNDDTGTAVYHAFTVLAYLFPLAGAMIADSWWGKYHTILWLSIVYAIGLVLLVMGSIGPIGDLLTHKILSSIGLFVIAVGTGGIKPCVSAFGGDQFKAHQDGYRRSFFSLFYFAINAGSLVSTFVSPIIRDEVKCFDEECYAVAFGIPAALMVVAIIAFALGTPWYTRFAPSGNVFAQSCVCIYEAISNRDGTKKDHWLEHAENGTRERKTLIRDLKYVMRVLIMYIPLPLFWALFDQQGSRWTLMAQQMNGYIGALHLLPDQMQIVNPLLIVTLIPIFEVTLYPCLKAIKFNFSPLRRMGTGMFFAGIAFIVAALIQQKIDVSLTSVPDRSDETSLRYINTAECPIVIYPNPSLLIEDPGITLQIGEASNTKENFVKPGEYDLQFSCVGDAPITVTIPPQPETAHDIIFQTLEGSLTLLATAHPYRKSDTGTARLGGYSTFQKDVNIQIIPMNPDKFSVEDSDGGEDHIIPLANSTGGAPPHYEIAELKGDNGTYTINLWDATPANDPIQSVNVFMGTGGLYTIMVWEDPAATGEPQMAFYEDVYQNDVSLFWMIPQYFIITVGEVFLSVTGLEFAYSQAPASMKSVLQSFWLFTVSIGNIIVLIVAETALIPSQRDEYYLFAGLIFAAGIIFIFLAMWYTYVDEDEFADDDDVSSKGDPDDVTASDKEKAQYENVAYKRDYDTDTKM